ncbi:MAG: DUF1801 domain-containing protein [Tannerellaceae bacterium]|jgi:uncharacterized protein YdhG (YjbR/CyaY superfamily)|nr:DUF1801 domain-containing protein [Tannerellaceae bacterium]
MDNVDDYLASLSPEIQSKMEDIRRMVKEMAPEAVEKMAYGMPAFHLNNRPLIYYSAFKNHIGFYPIPTGIEAFREELSVFKQGKGSVQFPIGMPLPMDLIRRIVKFRIGENRQAAQK